jgi:hypothetical protein
VTGEAVGFVVGAVEGEVAQGDELGLDVTITEAVSGQQQGAETPTGGFRRSNSPILFRTIQSWS